MNSYYISILFSIAYLIYCMIYLHDPTPGLPQVAPARHNIISASILALHDLFSPLTLFSRQISRVDERPSWAPWIPWTFETRETRKAWQTWNTRYQHLVFCNMEIRKIITEEFNLNFRNRRNDYTGLSLILY